MKKFAKKLAPFIWGLVFVSFFIAAMIRLSEYAIDAAVLGVVIFVLLILMAVIGIKHRLNIKKQATAQTSGVISNARVSLFGDEYFTDYACTFKISYSVDNRKYQIQERDRVPDRATAKRYIGKLLTVHYAPDNPQVAWAELPKNA